MSRASRFDRADFQVKQATTAEAPRPSAVWPVDPESAILKLGESVLAKRKGSGRPHKGLDIMVPPGTRIVATQAGKVLRVIDGRSSPNPDLRRAGLFVDVLSSLELDELVIHRYLHLWKAFVRGGNDVGRGARIALSGTTQATGIEHSQPHIHFEIRRAILDHDGRYKYGDPIDPLRVLPIIHRSS